MFGKQQVLYFLGRQPLLYFIWQALVAFLYSMFGLAAAALFFWQPTCCFFGQLSSPLLSVFAYDEIVQFHTLSGI
jgi:hypothetical protein